MAIYLVKLSPGSGVNRSSTSKAMIVEADDATKAKEMAAARYGGDSVWPDTTTIATPFAADLEGAVHRVRVSGGAGNADLHDVSYTAGSSATIDTVGAALVELLRGGAVSACIQDDGGVFADKTTEANSATADDVAFPTTPVSGDAILIGGSYKFNRALINVTTAGVGTYTIAWKYWNGTAWAAISSPTDDTGALKTAGLNDVTFTPPSNWAASTVNSQGPFYYIKAEIDGGTHTTDPLIGQVYVGAGLRSTYDSGTDVLTVAAVADGIGNRTLKVEITPNGVTQPVASLVGTIVDKGVAAAVLSVDLTGPTLVPAILEEI
jgi:hypothetical protein